MAQLTTSMRLSIFLLISFKLIVGRLGWAVNEGTVWVGTRRSPTVECFHIDCNSGSMSIQEICFLCLRFLLLFMENFFFL